MFSVIICTHNPREDYLKRTLEALQGQTEPTNQWELLLIDNRSDIPLERRFDLSWHHQARIIREEELGLTPARIRGIRESAGKVVIFVDDDNVLAPDYLEFAKSVEAAHPSMGVWGASIEPEFETAPSEDMKELVPYLGLRKLDRDYWCNFGSPYQPIGAGLCIRRQVAEAYVGTIESNPTRKTLDRKGSGLLGCGDFDIVFTGVDLGLGYGVFHRLKVTHLIPSRRVDPEYLKALAAGCEASSVVLGYLRDPSSSDRRDPRSLARRIFSHLVSLAERVATNRSHRIKLAALDRGREQGLELIRSFQPIAR
jgi:glycosyltransferase involved in cell wall biosynthesis